MVVIGGGIGCRRDAIIERVRRGAENTDRLAVSVCVAIDRCVVDTCRVLLLVLGRNTDSPPSMSECRGTCTDSRIRRRNSVSVALSDDSCILVRVRDDIVRQLEKQQLWCIHNR